MGLFVFICDVERILQQNSMAILWQRKVPLLKSMFKNIWTQAASAGHVLPWTYLQSWSVLMSVDCVNHMGWIMCWSTNAVLSWPCPSLPWGDPLHHTRELTLPHTDPDIMESNGSKTGELGLPPVGKLPLLHTNLALGLAGPTPYHRHGRAGSASHQKVVVPATRS